MDGTELIEIDTLDEPAEETTPPRGGPKRPDPVIIEDASEPEDEGTDDPGEELQRQLDAQKRRTQDALARANVAEGRVRQAEGVIHQERQARQTTELSAFDQQIAALKDVADNAGSALKAALDAGENAKVVELQRQLARAESRLERAEERKKTLGDDVIAGGDRQDLRRGGAVRTEQPAPRQPTQDEYVEQVLSGMSPKLRAWFENGRLDYITDPEKQAMAAAVDARAVKRGLIRQSDEYFEYAEKELARMGDEGGGATRARQNGKEPTPPPTRRKAVPAVPVERGGGGGQGGAGGKPRVELTQGEKRAATDGTLVWNTGPKKGEPIGIQEFARRKYIRQQQIEQGLVENE